MSDEKIVLFNNGDRVIECEGGVKFRPRTSVEFPKALGEKLARLYKGEVQNIADAMKPFAAPTPAVEAEEPTKPEPTEEELKLQALQEEAEKRSMTVDQLIILKAEVEKAMAEGLSQEEAEHLVFGDAE